MCCKQLQNFTSKNVLRITNTFLYETELIDCFRNDAAQLTIDLTHDGAT